jgi:preprotein translocase subunit SecA
MRRFGGQNVANLMDRFGVEEDIPIEAGIVSKSIENAQTKVEGHNFDIRKHLLKYDDVINQQREVTYAERRRILASSNLRETIQGLIDSHLSDLVKQFTAGEDPKEWDLAALHSAVRMIVPLPPTLTSGAWSKLSAEEIEEQILDLADEKYEEMEQTIGAENLRQWERALMLQVTDMLWVRHLTALDDLRQGIGLRAYGQQDPLVSFQKEAYEMYGQLRAAIQEEVVRRIYHHPPTATNIIKEAPRPRNIQAIHPDAAATSQAEASTPGATKQAPEPVRVQKLPGRNDLCYCGSGKKYKHCHMKLDIAGGNGSDAAPAAVGSIPARPDQGKKKSGKGRR